MSPPSARGARRLLAATALSLGLAGACDLTTEVPRSDDDFELPAAPDDGGVIGDEEDPLDAGDEPAGDDGGRDAGDDRPGRRDAGKPDDGGPDDGEPDAGDDEDAGVDGGVDEEDPNDDDGGVDPSPDVSPPDEPELDPLPIRTREDPCATLTPTIVGTSGPDELTGTDGDDVIFGLGGDDVILGLGGNDIICGGYGEDCIHGGGGHDYIDGGFANDVLFGDDGDDVIHGRNGGDRIHGGLGDDELYGDVLDDFLFGDEGDDLLVGGHGVDALEGGNGADWLRGDTNGDDLFGGAGVDTVSFMTATPPGGDDDIDGVVVDLQQGIAYGHSGEGVASNPEPVVGVEAVVGSAFDDKLTGDGASTLKGDYGDDVIQALPGDSAEPGAGAADRSTVFAFVDQRPRDIGLVVLGTTAADAFELAMESDTAVRVFSTDGAAVTAGPGCVALATTAVRCVPGGVLRYVLAWGDDGDDDITLHDGFPRDMTAHIDGGEGNDTLTGGDGEDVLFSGRTGEDVLVGKAGDDALISQSTGIHQPRSSWTGGADHLDTGPGDDQLVTDYPCGGHTYIGGPGIDIAGFARSGNNAPSLQAQLGGAASTVKPFHGRAGMPSLCSLEEYTTLAADLEILEAAGGDDDLWGNDDNNVIWGRQGNDAIYGLGGNDIILGHDGADTIYGGDGDDRLRGGQGVDTLFGGEGVNRIDACDGEADDVRCNADEGVAFVDGEDATTSCTVQSCSELPSCSCPNPASCG